MIMIIFMFSFMFQVSAIRPRHVADVGKLKWKPSFSHYLNDKRQGT